MKSQFEFFQTNATDQTFTFLDKKLFVINAQKGGSNKIISFYLSWAHGILVLIKFISRFCVIYLDPSIKVIQFQLTFSKQNRVNT